MEISLFTHSAVLFLGFLGLFSVAGTVYEHDKTGMAEPFRAIEERLKAAFVDIAQGREKAAIF
ncbi:hypothetical protein D3Z51_17735 [Clostridiaceae bacterium]|nr:hypothetical protein [Clostridiaceae bacterium]RKI09417.1 hypothetical protein D7V81_17315 [bacterium 1XD21-70]